MSWQRAVFFGGAVLVLSACGDATAPASLNRVDGTLNSKRAATSDSTTTVDPTGGGSDECTGVVIHVGSIGGSIVPVCILIPPPGSTF